MLSYTTPTGAAFTAKAVIDELDSAMQYFMPDKGREQMRTVTCLYTRTPGRQFVASPIKEHKDIIVLMGAAHAFKFAPTIGRAAAELAIDGETKEDISKFSLDTIVKPCQARTTADKSRL
ncbi:FAD dependent oxidoreductase [Diaporthe eres]|nr:FAD dependent oxidoreductase [Diaporthe eres]